MTTLFDATMRLAAGITPLRESDVTAQDNNSLTDTLAAFSDSHVGGTIWMLAGNLAGTSIIVTGKVSATELSFATQAANLEVGDHYALANSDFPRGTLRRAVNEALRELSPRIEEDDTLETVSDEDEYILPEGVREVMRVWIASELTAPYRYEEAYHWDEVNGLLRFARGWEPHTDNYKIKVAYRAAHEDLNDDADQLPADVDDELVHWQAMVWLAGEGNRRFPNDPQRDLANIFNAAREELMRARRNWNRPSRSARPADF